MKLTKYLTLAVLLSVLSLFAASCGDDGDDDSASTTTAPAPATTAAAPATTAAAPATTAEAMIDPVRVAVVAPSASNDLAFTQSIVEGVEALGDHVSEWVITDGTFIVEEAALAIRGYAEEGYDLVIAHGSQYGGSLQEIAPDFPDVTFAWGTAADTFGLDNVYAYTAASDQGGCVLGAVAAHLTPSGNIGVVGPIEVGDAKLYVDGFKNCAEAEQDGVNVNVVYIDSFSDVAKAAETAESHIANGADILTGSAQMVVGAVGVAQENDVWWFGTQADQRSLAPSLVVASQVYNWEVVLEEIIADMSTGAAGGRAFVIELDNGGLEIAFNDAVAVPPNVLQRADEVINGIINGSISTGA